MHVWIVNPFDPLPGDPEQEGRYATLARQLVQRGHRVVWWTSSFSHRFKRPVDQAAIRAACAAAHIGVRFTEAPPYQRNVSYARIRNHAALAKRFRAEALQATERPDVIVISSPPPVLAHVGTAVAQQLDARSIIDVQDLWPDNFKSLVAPLWRPFLAPAIWALRRNVRRAARQCDAIVGVADAYVEDSYKEAGARKPTATIPLGIDLAAFDAAAEAGECEEFTKPDDHVWLAYTGSLNRNYDFLTILRAVVQLGDELPDHVRFFLTSRGELADEAARIVRENDLRNVTLTGFLEFETWAHLLSQCDAGFNASFPEAMIFLPNKIFYYFAAGAAVLNTIPGQCSRIVRDAGCGLDYEAGNVASCAEVIKRVVFDDDARERMRQESRHLAETVYDRARLFPRYAELIEQVGADAAR